MPTYSETGSGGIYGAGIALVTSHEVRATSGGIYASTVSDVYSLTPSASRATFLAKFVKGGSAYILQNDGSKPKRVKIVEFHDDGWGAGYYDTNIDTTLVFGGPELGPAEYLTTLNIIDDIGTREVYRRYLNAVK